MEEFHRDQPFPLENGQVLPDIRIGYHTYGHLNATGDNVVWVCHALTANSDVIRWWPGMVAITLDSPLAMASRSYEVFHVVLTRVGHAASRLDSVLSTWKPLLGQRVIQCDDHERIAEVVVSAIRLSHVESHCRYGSPNIHQDLLAKGIGWIDYSLDRWVVEDVAPPPSAYPRFADGTLTSAQHVLLKDVSVWHKRIWRPDVATFVVVGDVTPDQATSLLAKNFAAFWPS